MLVLFTVPQGVRDWLGGDHTDHCTVTRIVAEPQGLQEERYGEVELRFGLVAMCERYQSVSNRRNMRTCRQDCVGP